MSLAPTSSDYRLPRYTSLIPVVLSALKENGGSATTSQLNALAIERLGLSESQLESPYGDGVLRTKLQLKLTWTRTILKNGGLISNPKPGSWVLRDPALDVRTVNPEEIWRLHRQRSATRRTEEVPLSGNAEGTIEEAVPPEESVGFTNDDFDVLRRNQRSLPWPELPDADRNAIKALRNKLLTIAEYLKDTLQSRIGFRAFASHPNPSGRNSLYYWSCVYPVDVPNKAFGFQLFVIVKPESLEIGFGAGSGTAEIKRPEELERLQQVLSATRGRLKTLREEPWLHSLADEATRAGYRLRPKWLRATDDMASLTPVQWVDHAASEDGAGAAISRFVPRVEALEHGDDFAEFVRGELQRFVPILEAVYGGVNPESPAPEPSAVPKPPLTLDWLVEQTLWPKERLAEIVDDMESGTRQIVLAGPPGTSKTWVARLLARFLTHDRPGAVHLVQFHPSYSYEEFIEGLRPVSKNGAISFERRDGFVLSIVKDMPSNVGPSVVVIDEMNRANLPKVFGELMYLFEYRDEPLDLQYSRGFRLPLDLLFIGTMNTADRSIRSIDIALRRRFDVFECSPDSAVLARFYEQGPINEVADLVEGFEKLNGALTDEIDLHHTIGHAFFMTTKSMTRDRLAQIWKRKIGPLISEYFFDQPDRAASFTPSRFWSGL